MRAQTCTASVPAVEVRAFARGPRRGARHNTHSWPSPCKQDDRPGRGRSCSRARSVGDTPTARDQASGAPTSAGCSSQEALISRCTPSCCASRAMTSNRSVAGGVPSGIEHRCQALRRLARHGAELLEANGGDDVVAQKYPHDLDLACEQAMECPPQAALPKLWVATDSCLHSLVVVAGERHVMPPRACGACALARNGVHSGHCASCMCRAALSWLPDRRTTGTSVKLSRNVFAGSCHAP